MVRSWRSVPMSSGTKGPTSQELAPDKDVFLRAHWGDIEMALSVYREEQGHYPEKLALLISSEWITAGQLRFSGYQLQYTCAEDGQSYELTVTAANHPSSS